MASSTATPKRAQPGTHPSVWAGLLLAIAGLVMAMYAYTGTRIYDITFAFIALAGGAISLVGILTAAWGRAIMAARAQRARRGFATKRAEPREETPVEVRLEETPPTVAEPAEKKRRLALPPLPKLGRRRSAEAKGADADDAASGKPSVFQFRRRNATNGSAATAAPVVEEAPPEPAAAAAADDPTRDGAVVRITLKCPQCSTEFSAEGVQPIPITCPSCGLSGTA